MNEENKFIQISSYCNKKYIYKYCIKVNYKVNPKYYDIFEISKVKYHLFKKTFNQKYHNILDLGFNDYSLGFILIFRK